MRGLALPALMLATVVLAYLALCLTVPPQVHHIRRVPGTEDGQGRLPSLAILAQLHPVHDAQKVRASRRIAGAGGDTLSLIWVGRNTPTHGEVRLWLEYSATGATSLVEVSTWQCAFLNRGWLRIKGWNPHGAWALPSAP